MTLQEALDFADMSACMAVDQQEAWGDLHYSIDNYRENIRTTLHDCGVPEFEQEAFETFDAKIKTLCGRER